MPLNENERTAIEGIAAMLNEDVNLGLSFHDKDPYDKLLKAERGYQNMHSQIQDMFAVKTAQFPDAFRAAVNQAFTKVHNYKYVDDPSFVTAMNSELVSQGVPADISANAVKVVNNILNQLRKEQLDFSERDSGFNPNLDEVVAASTPEQPSDFEIEDDGGYMNRNVEFEIGKASPGHMSED